MKRKLLLTCLAVFSALSLYAVTATVDGIKYYLDASSNTASVASSNSTSLAGDLVIPSSIEYNDVAYGVTSIGSSAFNGCSSLTSVAIPNGVTSIGSFAFNGCSSLTSVAIPNSVTSIGKSAFYGCSSLTSVTIPNSAESIDDYAFCNCSGLSSITVESGNTIFDSRENCNAIINTASNTLVIGCKNTIIPNSVTRIGRDAFYGCSGLTSITIPESVKQFYMGAFSGCNDLTSVVWNATNCSITTISTSSPFYDIRSQITSFTIGNEVTHIPSCLCYGMNNLTSITIPNSVTSIGSNAFYGCSGLTSITIPNSVTRIVDDAFLECSGLTYVNINDVAAWCNITFSNYYSNPLYYAKHLYINYTEVTSLVIPNGVTSIGKYAFYNCSGLSSVTISKSVTRIGSDVFSGCDGLTSIVWNATNCASPSNSYSHFYDIRTQITSFTIGNEITTIPSQLCSGMNNLTSITIPNSVTSIGDYAFNGCSSLTSVAIPNSVTSIGKSAFYGCSSLTSITIPNSVTSIGAVAFGNCDGLTSIVWNATNCASSNSVSSSPFYFVRTQITSFTIGNEVSDIPSYLCYEMVNLTSVTIPNSVTSISFDAFKYCYGLTSVTIGNGVTSIGGSAFYGCSRLQTIYAHPITLPTTGTNAFYNVPTSTILYVPTESKSLYQGAVQWNSFTTIRELHDVTVGDAEWASLCLPYDAEIPVEVTVYQGEVGNGYVSLSEIEHSNKLPANTGCVINAPAGTYTFLQTTETPAAVQNNDILGVTANTAYSTLNSDPSKTLLTLGLDNDDNVGFHRPNTTYSPQLEAYKAYILYPGVAQAPLRVVMPGENNPIATGNEVSILAENKITKAMLNGQLVIVRGGHIYDLNGKIYE